MEAAGQKPAMGSGAEDHRPDIFWELGHCHRAYLLDVEHATQYLEALNDR
jgi:hypothetical protein